MKHRVLLPYGYRTYTGQIMSDAEVDSYNYIQGRINACIDAEVPVSEGLLNESHKCLQIAALRHINQS
jgi:hypothetical protein